MEVKRVELAHKDTAIALNVLQMFKELNRDIEDLKKKKKDPNLISRDENYI